MPLQAPMDLVRNGSFRVIFVYSSRARNACLLMLFVLFLFNVSIRQINSVSNHHELQLQREKYRFATKYQPADSSGTTH